jgi:hypothetical protein
MRDSLSKLYCYIHAHDSKDARMRDTRMEGDALASNSTHTGMEFGSVVSQ